MILNGPLSGKPSTAPGSVTLTSRAKLERRPRRATARAGPRRRCAGRSAIAVASSRSPLPLGSTTCRPRRRRRARSSRRRPLPATQPEPATPRPQEFASTRTTDCRRAACTSGSRATDARGGGTSTSGPRMFGNGSKRASALRTLSDGRIVVELLEDHRALDRAAQVADARRLQHDHADEPGEPERERDRQHAAEQAVEDARTPASGCPLAARPRCPPRRPTGSTPPTSAPSRPNSGANGEALPSSSSCGPNRVPR